MLTAEEYLLTLIENRPVLPVRIDRRLTAGRAHGPAASALLHYPAPPRLQLRCYNHHRNLGPAPVPPCGGAFSSYAIGLAGVVAPMDARRDQTKRTGAQRPPSSF
jgi:hypothetical protein